MTTERSQHPTSPMGTPYEVIGFTVMEGEAELGRTFDTPEAMTVYLVDRVFDGQRDFRIWPLFRPVLSDPIRDADSPPPPTEDA